MSLVRGLLRIATNWCTGEVAGSTEVMRFTDLRAHPGRIVIVFGASIAFAITGFLHLVADGDAPDIYTGLMDRLVQNRLTVDNRSASVGSAGDLLDVWLAEPDRFDCPLFEQPTRALYARALTTTKTMASK
jgi:hypothetical protein